MWIVSTHMSGTFLSPSTPTARWTSTAGRLVLSAWSRRSVQLQSHEFPCTAVSVLIPPPAGMCILPNWLTSGCWPANRKLKAPTNASLAPVSLTCCDMQPFFWYPSRSTEPASVRWLTRPLHSPAHLCNCRRGYLLPDKHTKKPVLYCQVLSCLFEPPTPQYT